MITSSLIHVRDVLHAQLCYQAFITPIFFPLEKEYRHFAKLACEFIEGRRTEVIHQEFPRHHVLHRFAPQKNAKGKKVLITHGWISRAAYMAHIIQALHQQGYEVYALDFPAHGEAKGLQLPWTDAVAILKDTINQHGPFYAVIGHSFGGSMLLNTLNIAGQLPEWQLNHKPERAILIASPTHMRSPINRIAKKFKLSGHGYLQLRQVMKQQARFDINLIRLNHFLSQSPSIPFLCIHGELDKTISTKESIEFCKKYPDSRLCLLPDANHVSVLMDDRVDQLVCNFLE
ncbi:TPA: alpha/beta hydrolase [Legionella anisa]|uniref:alpha/beta hydrolase n=1 Tax=Legionella anisa TaxID=28082 RepID=UPI00034A1CD9|nr:alpha/beta fold hydrolase [Legionella anisa]AWN72580.1 alpha/beta hydrolase [Legionella anisa]MBN5935647.1 alpha/beta fold hydrolase [Legionella anisa]MCW8423354.1 alpha/beta fold hydrolase [Legionella anisa]MCW8446874.1 alpha/beta fold hydrolase [Legionella anisa]